MITSHGYIDNPTFRGMRWHLRNTFDKIYVLDLHGNSRKKETTPNGDKDENVFDIMSGVSVVFGVKILENKDKKLAQVYKADLYGLRKEKFDKLDNLNIDKIDWIKIPEDNDAWVLEGKGKSEYLKGFSLSEIFTKNSTGILTMGDSFIIAENRDVLIKRVDDFLNNNVTELELKNKYGLGKNYAKWIIDNKKKIENNHSKIVPLSYRPFDIKYTYFDNNLVWRPRTGIMQHFINKENVGLLITKAVNDKDYNHIFITDAISESIFLSGTTATNAINSPLYLYMEQEKRIPNLNEKIWNKINEKVGETTPENILDYIYAVLHSPKYREKYREFLKTDFPRVPYPEDKEKFWNLVKMGEKLRGLHLMTDKTVNDFITTYSVSGDNLVDKISYKDENVYINEDQYFGNVPEIAWNFYIGGYQPAQKYLKDRKGRNLTSDEIEHYQKIIKVLIETDKTMKEIDKIR